VSTPLSDSTWLNDVDLCPLEHLVEVSGLSIEEIEDLIDTDVITPVSSGAQTRLFQLRYVVTVKTARRLRDDFELDRHGLSLALSLLQRIDELQAELGAAKARLGGSAR
jgi:chaperone modulatory protein CbpM